MMKRIKEEIYFVVCKQVISDTSFIWNTYVLMYVYWKPFKTNRTVNMFKIQNQIDVLLQ